MVEKSSGCPYKNAKNKFSFFGLGREDEKSERSDYEKGLKKGGIELGSNPHKDISKEEKCPFGFGGNLNETRNQTPKSEKLENLDTKEEKKLSDDEDEEPQGGCPVMNKGKIILNVSKEGSN